MTETYHGGRNEQFIFGPADRGNWHDCDLSSAYTTAMSLIGFPKWDRIERLNGFDGIDQLDLAYFSVDFEFPKTVRFPSLPVRTANGIIFPQKGQSFCCAPELVLAQQLGAKLTFRRGLKVETDQNDPVFRSFIQTSIKRRSQHGKKTFDNMFWKEVGNSTYGKTAQGLRQKRVYDLREDDMVALPESQLTQPYFASFITSYTRAVLGEVLNSFPPDVQVFSVTTDGFLSNASQADIEKAKQGSLFRSFEKARQELVQDDAALEIKHSIHRPIGWRTRGSATLEKGDGSNGIVLQKGGIKTNELLDEEGQNRHIIDLFLNRKPDSIVEYRVGIGLKDMIRFDADFVSRSVTKLLSMEYDWKRRHINERDVSFEFDGQIYTHLGFATVPVEDVEEFNRIREAWDKYDIRPHKRLKSLRDFNNFVVFLETNKDQNREAAKYLRQKDGDLKRARRDLARAFKNHGAGFDREREKRWITHNDFCRALEDCGISCSISDLDNALRAKFKPHQTPKTDRVLACLKKLKEKYFPNLEIEVFLPEEGTAKIKKPIEDEAA